MKSSERAAAASGAQTTTIGALAEYFGLATHVLRHWEGVGLLTPRRDTAGRRRYSAEDFTRVAVILRAKEAGLSLATIRDLAATADARRRRDTLKAEAAALRARIAAAQASLELIECALGCDHDDLTRCAHFRQLVAEPTAALSVG
ncbi:MerR family transcriptional regulator [Streptomyces sp. Ru71]|uniref:MerR family transcriptional regulator n=1 Tax=Streptomyces sp. Ru71 TaxID=2080746 RepID=UPI000CDDACD0|nr:MerR family transcriptional regulator [Streptomyces sp. Ru71]POX48451.1 MerR family transcriptional regulator [Streptomyces sp. Ru71]